MAIIQETNVNLATHVRDVLNAAGGSVSNDVTTLFKKDAKLNMWSRYKPVVIANVPFINLWSSTSAGNYAYMGDNLDCGIEIPFYSDYTKLQTALKNNSGHFWSYTPPTGGTAKPMRLGDFRRYNTDAINPIGSLPGTFRAVRGGSGDTVEISVEVTVENNSTYNLGISDLHVNQIALSSMYLGVYLIPKNTNKNQAYFRTFNTKIGTNRSFTMTLPLTYGDGGTFIAHLFVSSLAQGDDLQSGGTLASLNKPSQEVNVKAAGTNYVLIASGYVTQAGGKEFNYEVTIYNDSGSSTTFQNVYVRLQHYIDGTWQNEGNPILIEDSVTIANGNKVLLTGTGTHSTSFSLNDLESGYYRIYAYSTTPSVIGDPSYIEPPSPEE